MDVDLKAKANALFKETIDGMLEAERIAKDPSVKGYNDLDELFAGRNEENKDSPGLAAHLSHRGGRAGSAGRKNALWVE